MISYALWLFAGGIVAVVNAVIRQRTVASLSTETIRGSLVLVLGGMLLRLGLVAGLLVAGLRQGVVSGLLAFAGLWLARGAIVVWFGVGWPGLLKRVSESAGD